MDPLLLSSWDRAWRGMGAEGTGAGVRDAVLARYAEKHRHYHTVQHLTECLSLFDAVRHAPDRPAEVEMALWFHDAIYDLEGSDNEARSAAWAQAELVGAGVEAAPASRVAALILITRHTGVPQTRDEMVLVDIDLAILGAPEARFAAYEHQIREEYAHVPALLFRLKRREILQSFLDRPAIYSTPVLHRQLEARARANLTAAVASSAGASPPRQISRQGPSAPFTLEERRVAHAAELFEVLRDERLYAFLDEEPPRSVQELAARLARSESRLSPDGKEHWLNWIIRAESGAVIGYVQATVEESKETNVAYVLAPDHQGQGIATAAVEAMLELVRDGYGATTFFIRAERANEPSVQLAQRLGFTLAPAQAHAARQVGPGEVLYCRRARREDA